MVMAGTLGFACARAATPPSAGKETAVASPSAPAAPAAADAAEAHVDGDTISVNGARVGPEELATALSQAGGGELLGIKLTPGYSEEALLRLFDAGSRAGFPRISLALGSQTLTVATSYGRGKTRLVAWVSEGRLTAYDLQSSAEENGMLGPFQLSDATSLAALRAQLGATCRDQPCSVELDVLPGSRAGLWHTLHNWHGAVSTIPRLAYGVLVVGITPPTNASTEAPTAKYGAVSDRLPPVVIQHIVRKNFGKFRACYEAGLGRKTDLTGRVGVRFVIGRDGKVSDVVDGGSDLPDAEVVECTLRAFYSLEFPPPANGIVTVVYPIMFAPG